MKLLGKIDKTIFSTTAVVYLAIFLAVLIVPTAAGTIISNMLNFTLNSAGWVYIFAYVIILCAFLFFGLSKYGKIRLGGPDSKPEYSFFSWIALLMGSGLGIGLVFFGVTEPMMHFMAPPFSESGTAQAAADAMRITFFHWGIPFWVLYGMAGLVIGYFMYNKGLPGLFSSAFAPMLGEKNTRGKIGKIIDSLSLIAIICGVSMALGFATTQFSSGLNLQYGLPISFPTLSMVAILIGLIATISCISGLAKGIKYLGDANAYLVIFFLIFTLIFGSTSYLIKSFIENYGNMLANFPRMLSYMDSYGITEAHTGYNWVGSWTIMYWAWSAAFAPFVGGFLAEISKGRTIREFVLAVTFVPGIICSLWFNFLGGEAIRMEMFEHKGIGEVIMANTDNSLFVFLSKLPISYMTIPIAMLLIVTLIVTTVNSATYVASTFSSGGKGVPTLGIRTFWGIFIVGNAIAFMAIGGLDTLKNASIVLAFPFTIIVLLMVINLFIDMKKTYAMENKDSRSMAEVDLKKKI